MDAPQPNVQAIRKPTSQERIMAELEAQRNQAMTQSALHGAELMATRELLEEANARNEQLQTSLTAAQDKLIAIEAAKAQSEVAAIEEATCTGTAALEPAAPDETVPQAA